MAFLDYEESVEEGQPIELYLFKNLEEEYVYTSCQEVVTFGGRNYLPVAVKRTSPELATAQSDRTLTVELPIDNPFALRYVATVPASPDEFTLYRYHSTDSGPEVVQYFKGDVVNVGFSNQTAKVNISSAGRVLAGIIPQQTCRNLCNHVLYNSRCSVLQANFTMDVTVTNISSNKLTLNVDGGSNMIGGKTLSQILTADARYFTSGMVSRNSYENRMVNTCVDLGGDVAQITVLLPFQVLSVGTVLAMSAGCTHSVSNCKNRFNNLDRYGGFPYIPQKNPFTLKLTGGS